MTPREEAERDEGLEAGRLLRATGKRSYGRDGLNQHLEKTHTFDWLKSKDRSVGMQHAWEAYKQGFIQGYFEETGR